MYIPFCLVGWLFVCFLVLFCFVLFEVCLSITCTLGSHHHHHYQHYHHHHHYLPRVYTRFFLRSSHSSNTLLTTFTLWFRLQATCAYPLNSLNSPDRSSNYLAWTKIPSSTR
uniref:Putative secreted protein n=1 Tax=Anopheles darlingi TaxID=43151 RepID=A0A2M4D9W8_ANODA